MVVDSWDVLPQQHRSLKKQNNPVNGIRPRESSNMPKQPQLTLSDYAAQIPHPCLLEQPLVWYMVMPAVAKYPSQRFGTKGVELPPQFLGPGLATTKQDRSTKVLKTATLVLLHKYLQRHTPLFSESMIPQAHPRRLLTSRSQLAVTLISLPR